jgi:hypothetical protein
MHASDPSMPDGRPQPQIACADGLWVLAGPMVSLKEAPKADT